ncbi:hypothetical protein [Microbacterium sp. 22296]|uniref:hypothetical protein n=1 Tax=Microbacterium sp. 22296 TaxID=3453903 RepID=UPI003F86578A
MQGIHSSFVDLLSNRAFLREVELDEELAELAVGAGNPNIMPIFLHEAAHFSSMSRWLGTALTLLWLRASSTVRDRPESQRAADAARIAAFSNLMRPWLEGIACYAQFDATPGGAESLSSVGQMFLSNFVAEDLRAKAAQSGGSISDDDLSELIAQKLARMRFAKQSVSKKADLLLSPLHFADGGYLAGYLCVKAFAGICESASGLASDTDLMLSYVQSVVLEDPGLIVALLRTSDDRREAVSFLAEKVRDRIAFVSSQDFRSAVPDDLARFDHDLATGGLSSDFAQSRHVWDADAVEAAADLLTNELQQAMVDPLGHDALLIRNVFTVGTSAGTAKVDASGTKMIFDYGNDKTEEKTLLVPLDPGEHAGSLTFMIVAPELSPAVSIEVGGRVVSLTADERILNGPVGALLRDHSFDIDGALRLLEARDLRLIELELPGAWGLFRPAGIEDSPATWNSYLELALFVARDRARELFESMWETGVWNLLGKRRELVLALVLVSTSSSNHDHDLMARAWDAHGLDGSHLKDILNVSNNAPIYGGAILSVALLDDRRRFHSMF